MLAPRGRARSALAVETSATEEERRLQAEARALEERRLAEEQRRKILFGSSEAWFKARRLRRFIRACEAAMRVGPDPAGGWSEAWLAWAREEADRLDPMTNGFVEAERERLATGTEGVEAYLTGALVRTRILVRKKRTGMEEIVRAVQVFGLGKGQLLDSETVSAALSQLMVDGRRKS